MQSKKVAYTFRFILGLIFIVSAFLKLKTIGAFGLYVYGFNWFPMDVSFVMSRLLVGFELFLGIALLLNRWNRVINALVFTTLTVLTVFLAYLVFIGNDGNCHCFGEMVDFSPTESIVKNIIFFILLYFSSKSEPFDWRHANIVFPLLLLISLAAPFISNMPENMMEKKQISYDQEHLSSFLNREDIPVDLKEGKRILCLFSTTCKHCRIAAKKMDIIMDKYAIPDTIFFWGMYDTKGEMEHFISDSEIKPQKYLFLDSEIFSITKGRLPLILLMEDGRVVEKMSNQTLSEEKISDFMGNND